MIHIADAISSLCPNISFKVHSSYDSIEFINPPDSFIQPSEEEVQLKIDELTAAEPMRLLREERDRLLSQSDWRDLPSYPGSNQEAWRTYRQQLRDLPSTTDPSNPTWPTAPEND